MTKKAYKAADATFKALRGLNPETLFGFSELQYQAESARDEWENKSEKWQESEAGCDAREQLERLETAVEELEAACNSLVSCQDALTEMQENAPEGSFD